MLSVSETSNIRFTWLPEIEVTRATASAVVVVRLESPRKVSVETSVLNEASGTALAIRIRTEEEDEAIEVWVGARRPSGSGSGSGSGKKIFAPNATVIEGQLLLGDKALWVSHPKLNTEIDGDLASEILRSWEGSPKLRPEVLGENLETIKHGLRAPQIGALHALAAHWSVKRSHAKIVLPTGTGKTDVMISASIMHGARRTLVVVPSDALRVQTAQRFKVLGILEEADVLNDETRYPIVGLISKSFGSIEEASQLRPCNVVVTTTQMLTGIENGVLEEFLSWFDIVFFDEAHHLAAPTWQRISGLIEDDKKVVCVTATPFRNDRKKVPGELIYQFPLRMAQEQGYFKKIGVVEINEADPEVADRLIARKAVEQLIADEGEGYKHIIMARAHSIEHAKILHETIYSAEFPELLPVVINSGVSKSQRALILDGLKRLEHRIVICVNMLGEGYDLPALKIAAMHELHRSLPITLQFIGRFTRSASTVGNPTVIANMVEQMTSTTVADLFAEDADWNELIPDMTAYAIKNEEDLANFSASMRKTLSPDNTVFDLSLLRPKTSASIFRASSFTPRQFRTGLPRAARVHQVWESEDQDLLAFITQERKSPDWTFSLEATDFEWHLHLVSYDSEAGLIYIHSSQNSKSLGNLARAVSARSARLVSGEAMFKAFHGLQRSVLHNVGLYKKGKLRFQMLAGIDIGEQVSTAVQSGSAKSNLFAVGYDDGQRTSIGASFKGKLWSMASTSIPDWVSWCKRISSRVMDPDIPMNDFLQFALIPTEITALPSTEIFACIPPLELLVGAYQGDRKLVVDLDQRNYSQVDISLDVDSVGSSGVVALVLDVAGRHRCILQLAWDGGFKVRRVSGDRVRIYEGAELIEIANYLEEHPPALLLRDGSEVVGGYHFRSLTRHPYTFSPASIEAMDWGAVPITLESKWKNGSRRDLSVQGRLIDVCVGEDFVFVIDDDDAQEAADIIAIMEDRERMELEITLYHCKFSAGETAGARFKDLYEVCGQAVKSTRLVHKPDALLEHILKRESRLGGRATRFEKGSPDEMKSLLRRIGRYRCHMQVCIAQPGLSAAAMTPELSSILGAADSYVREFTSRRLRVLGSA